MEYREIIIIGAGASGLMCGYLLGKQNKEVLILDKNSSPGKKLSATGNGRCNFTNRHMVPACYFGDQNFVTKVLEKFDAERAVELFEEIGIYHREREGYCYPYNGQASSVVRLLVMACEENGVSFAFDTKVLKVIHKKDGYEVIGRNNVHYDCKKLILATGGKACESLGGDGSGYKLCRSLGHQITSVYPGLTGLKAAGNEWKLLSGVRMQGKVSLYSGERLIRSEIGEIQIVKDGISGIPVFQLCRLAAQELAQSRTVTCGIDFFPQMSEQELADWIALHGTEKLEGLLNQKWIRVLLGDRKTKTKLPARLKNYKIHIIDTFGLERAQVTAGGVVAEEVNPATMESMLQSDLYLLGELLDVDGICGGYNLHFAWATAYICSCAIETQGFC